MDNSTHNMSEKLVQYLDGELTGIDKTSLEQELAEDSALQDELNSLKVTREAVKMYGLQQKVSGIHQQMMEGMQAPVKKINPTRHILRYSIAVAASVVLIVGGIFGYNFYNLSSDKIFASNYQSYELSTLRDSGNQEMTPVETAYRGSDYKKVTELYVTGSSNSLKETFLAAMSYVELGNGAKAIEQFKKVIADNETAKTSLFKDEAEYYLALTYVRNGDYDYALDLLRNIKENPEHLYNEKMTGKLIRQVKMLKWR